ncbi:MAG: GNAT family N-acetyltransferase [Candidatus Eremiobacteraeota bacterium]|nr:GNAT family N-acetyltransferase [Candidatus Eremiobacteraeota bacterium]
MAEASERSAAEWSQQVASMPTFVAVRDDGDVGVARCALDNENPETAWLLSMWVASHARRGGIGSALVDAVRECARASGALRVVLDVADENGAAIALYASKGFVRSGATSTLPPPRNRIREHRRELRL